MTPDGNCKHDLRTWGNTPDARCIKCGINFPAAGEPYYADTPSCSDGPQWVYNALVNAETFVRLIDVAPANAQYDFLGVDYLPRRDIVTNPPFSLAEKFVRHSLKLTQPYGGKVAMLLPHAWDTAKTRRDLFEQKPFKAKYTLTKRIRWENLEQKKNGPSTNHAWFVWDWLYEGKPFLGYLP